VGSNHGVGGVVSEAERDCTLSEGSARGGTVGQGSSDKEAYSLLVWVLEVVVSMADSVAGADIAGVLLERPMNFLSDIALETFFLIFCFEGSLVSFRSNFSSVTLTADSQEEGREEEEPWVEIAFPKLRRLV
jgi:hypothetical protein